MVLLKNETNALPLNSSDITSVAVIGEDAVRHHATGLFGAGVKTMHEITPLEGIVQRVGDNVNVTYSIGYSKQAGSNLSSAPSPPPGRRMSPSSSPASITPATG